MQQLMDLFHRIYDVQGIVRVGGLALIAAIIFAETGLLVGFFLPGDSLLVTAGIYCTSANPEQAPLLNIVWLNLIVMVAAIVGDTVGYWIGAEGRTEDLHPGEVAVLLEEAPPPDAGVLRTPRRQDHHHRPLRADHPHLRPVSSRASAR